MNEKNSTALDKSNIGSSPDDVLVSMFVNGKKDDAMKVAGEILNLLMQRSSGMAIVLVLQNVILTKYMNVYIKGNNCNKKTPFWCFL
jgi:hypothetical protein